MNRKGSTAERSIGTKKDKAYAVLSYFGVDASGYSFAYVARWAESKELVKAALSRIQKTVRMIIGAVEDGSPRKEGEPERKAA